jgi:hypothetical protein
LENRQQAGAEKGGDMAEKGGDMTDRLNKASGVSHAPLNRARDEQIYVPPSGESPIGKGQDCKASSPQESREQPLSGENEQD